MPVCGTSPRVVTACRGMHPRAQELAFPSHPIYGVQPSRLLQLTWSVRAEISTLFFDATIHQANTPSSSTTLSCITG
eukprot:328375-Rhodomonas_salina.1